MQWRIERLKPNVIDILVVNVPKIDIDPSGCMRFLSGQLERAIEYLYRHLGKLFSFFKHQFLVRTFSTTSTQTKAQINESIQSIFNTEQCFWAVFFSFHFAFAKYFRFTTFLLNVNDCKSMLKCEFHLLRTSGFSKTGPILFFSI